MAADVLGHRGVLNPDFPLFRYSMIVKNFCNGVIVRNGEGSPGDLVEPALLAGGLGRREGRIRVGRVLLIDAKGSGARAKGRQPWLVSIHFILSCFN